MKELKLSAIYNDCKSYVAGQPERNTKKKQKYHSQSYLGNNTLYKDYMIENTAPCDMRKIMKLVPVLIVFVVLAIPADTELDIKSKRLLMYCCKC